MAQTNVTQFAKELGVPATMLLEQLQAAGVEKKLVADTMLTEQDKTQLLEYLRRVHGTNDYIWEEGDTSVRLPVEPDALFSLRFADRPLPVHFCYEADRGTMPIADMLTKFRAYYRERYVNHSGGRLLRNFGEPISGRDRPPRSGAPRCGRSQGGERSQIC